MDHVDTLESQAMPHHFTRARSLPSHLNDYHCYFALGTLHELQSYHEASSDPLWQKLYMTEELNTLVKTHMWDLVKLPPDKFMVGCKGVYKIKTWSNGTVEHYKACLMVKEFIQEYGIVYEEIFVPVVRLTSIRSLLPVASIRKCSFFRIDVKMLFSMVI